MAGSSATAAGRLPLAIPSSSGLLTLDTSHAPTQSELASLINRRYNNSEPVPRFVVRLPSDGLVEGNLGCLLRSPCRRTALRDNLLQRGHVDERKTVSGHGIYMACSLDPQGITSERPQCLSSRPPPPQNTRSHCSEALMRHIVRTTTRHTPVFKPPLRLPRYESQYPSVSLRNLPTRGGRV
ncbi:hypothetical protein B0H13DRAFT_2356565 [Mycena leptocephala]|nr:hypothetical protein B0H13DRAFT_2379977 [Mycena leptocephala]KAJ7858333.1 hypothetical protein B0H13DRAFT_2356565 [Mycena leptocephala]